MRTYAWRVCFILAALLFLNAGPRHPRGTFTEMLANPSWVQSHLLFLGAILALLAGVTLYRAHRVLPARTLRWARFVQIAGILEVLEMIVHTASVVDHQHMVAGEPTPVFTAHILMSIAFYPLYAAAVVGLIVAGIRDRSLGSVWIGWLGIIGAVAHGAAPILVVAMDSSRD